MEVPTEIDENLFFTIGLGLNKCPKNFRSRRCQGPNGTRFTASMNNVSFVLPNNMSILQAYQQNIPGVYTSEERFCHAMNEDEQMELPPGFRFHPTDEELISYYLSPKVLDSGFTAKAIGEVDLNKYEPWDLPWRAKMGEKEWYFFFVRDRKYPTGLRTNRATEAGYWKATGKDKEIYKAKALVGMKKTLVFYKGRAPNVLHFFCLTLKSSEEPAREVMPDEAVQPEIGQDSID